MRAHLLANKNYLLTAVALLLLLISYRFAFQPTLNAWQLHRHLLQQINESGNISYQPGYLLRKDSNLNHIIDLYKADTLSFRNNSISTISIIAEKENVKISELPMADPAYHNETFTIQRFSLEGNFFSLLRTIRTLQTTKGIGQIRSLNFKIKDLRTGTMVEKKLSAEIFLEITNKTF